MVRPTLPPHHLRPTHCLRFYDLMNCNHCEQPLPLAQGLGSRAVRGTLPRIQKSKLAPYAHRMAMFAQQPRLMSIKISTSLWYWISEMIFPGDFEILREIIRRKRYMTTWYCQSLRAGHDDPNQGARDIALAAKDAYESAVTRYAHTRLSVLAKKKIAYGAAAGVTESTVETWNAISAKPHKNSRMRVKRKMESWGKGRSTPSQFQRKDRKMRPSGADVVKRPEPHRRNHKEVDSIPSCSPFRKKGKMIAAGRLYTPSYVRYIDEGIGGTREQALNERKKLSTSMRKRAWDIDD